METLTHKLLTPPADADAAVMRFLRHHTRVAAVAGYLGPARRTPQLRDTALREAALLHDIGRLPLLSLTEQPRLLTEFERVAVAGHALVGAVMLESAGFPADVVAIVRYHHERWDGAGVPDGLAGLAIPLGARILAVADAVVAMAERRSYEPIRTLAQIREELAAQRERQFDPDLADRALQLLAMPAIRRLLGRPK
jgi:putative nucleotidyltransferase with HDIG domain